jgi:hypothetical protein
LPSELLRPGTSFAKNLFTVILNSNGDKRRKIRALILYFWASLKTLFFDIFLPQSSQRMHKGHKAKVVFRDALL